MQETLRMAMAMLNVFRLAYHLGPYRDSHLERAPFFSRVILYAHMSLDTRHKGACLHGTASMMYRHTSRVDQRTPASYWPKNI